MRIITDSLVTNYHFSAEKLNCDYYISMRHQCVLICAPEFCMSFANYLQMSLNCDQSLAAVLAQIRLLHTGGASASIKDFMHVSAQILSHQITVSVRSSDSVRALLLLTVSTDSVTGANV